MRPDRKARGPRTPRVLAAGACGALGLAAALLGACAPTYCECPIRPSALIVHATDATTGAALAPVSIVVDGAEASASCQDARVGAEAGVAPPCSAWLVPLQGHHDVAVSSPGYATQTFTVDIAPPGGGCCAQGERLDRPVALQRQ